MMCDYCGDDETGRTYTLEMEWPREYPEEYPDEPAQFDDPGRGTLSLCVECGDSIASKCDAEYTARIGH